MNDRRAVIIAKLKALIDTRKEAVRVRIVDRAFATLATLLLLCSTASAGPMRQVPPPKPTCRQTTIIIVVPRNYPRYNRPVTIYGTGWYPMGR
jgi:hypothetical protein